MPDQLQLRGGTTSEHSSFTGAAREVTVDTTKKTLVVHDGSQAGGTPLMKESGGTTNATINDVNVGKGANSVGNNTVVGALALIGSVSGDNNSAFGIFRKLLGAIVTYCPAILIEQGLKLLL